MHAAGPGWVPDPQRAATADPAGETALTSAAAAYTAAYGHPLEEGDLGEAPGYRWAVSGRVVAAAVVVLVLLVGAVVLRSQVSAPSTTLPTSEPDPAGTTWGEDLGGAEAAETPPAAPTVVVHVVGAVAAPGVFTLPGGSRIADAVEAAGGPTSDADLAAVNLARVLVDGEQVLVPRPGEHAAPPEAPAPGPAMVDVNTADAATLETLPGIGPVLAERIVAFRTTSGPFRTVEDLTAVSGIGPALLEGLRDRVRVG